MPLQTIILAALIVGFVCAQYILAVLAIRDLIRRPRVRGGNKVSWGLTILCLPIAGALIYGWIGPASFMRRASFISTEGTERGTGTPIRPTARVSRAGRAQTTRGNAAARSNVTPIGSRRASATRESSASPAPSGPARVHRTGS